MSYGSVLLERQVSYEPLGAQLQQDTTSFRIHLVVLYCAEDFNPVLKFNCICRSFNNGEDKSSDDIMVNKIELVPSRYSLNSNGNNWLIACNLRITAVTQVWFKFMLEVFQFHPDYHMTCLCSPWLEISMSMPKDWQTKDICCKDGWVCPSGCSL